MDIQTLFRVGIVWCLTFSALCEGNQTMCKEGWEAFGGSCYYFSAIKESWHSAQDLCTTEGGHLVRITSRAENEYLKMRVRSFPDFGKGETYVTSNRITYSPYWIDVTDQGSPGTYVYGSTQAPVNFVDWNPREPSNAEHHCVGLFHTFDYKWDDYSCADKRRFICEMKAETQDCSCRCSCCTS